MAVLPPAAVAATESWQQVSVTRFAALTALERSQGVATDGTSWFYSWRLGLTRTTLDGSVIVRNAAAIPVELAVQGSDHIGDGDYHAGRYYAPIEDSAYQRPTVALYDAATLRYTGTSYRLPASVQSHVPWVAVDAARGVLYSSDWDPAPTLNVFRLADLQLIGTVPFSQPVGRIQGGKLYQGALYLSSDNAAPRRRAWPSCRPRTAQSCTSSTCRPFTSW